MFVMIAKITKFLDIRLIYKYHHYNIHNIKLYTNYVALKRMMRSDPKR